MKKYTHAIVTGASSGIGEQFARLLAQQKVNLILIARREDRLKNLATELISEFSVHVDVLALDLSDSQSADKIFSFCQQKKYQIDLLINNAGFGAYKSFISLPVDEHIKTVNVNSVTPLKLMHLFANHMLNHKRPSSILNVASVASFIEIPQFTTYCATKSFLYKASLLLNFELKSTQVNVTCLCPGGTATEFAESNNQKVIGSKKAFMPAVDVAATGLNATQRGQALVVPGFANKLQIYITSALPSFIKMSVVRLAMRSIVSEKD